MNNAVKLLSIKLSNANGIDSDIRFEKWGDMSVNEMITKLTNYAEDLVTTTDKGHEFEFKSHPNEYGNEIRVIFQKLSQDG